MGALYYTKQEDTSVRCGLCPHHCHIQPGQTGLCRTRFNNNGTLQALNYGQCTSIALDPIEKKPLYHFHPGSTILSLGSWGCNMSCSFCQNWEISQSKPSAETVTPGQIVQFAMQCQPRGNIGVAYTYNEPTVWYEFIRETAPLIHAAGMYNVMVTNGFIETAPLQELLPYIDAWNIDLKAFDPAFYKNICKADFMSVRRTIEIVAPSAHVEITNLIVPGANDTAQSIREMAQWIAAIDPEIPLHITRYFPRYHMSAPPTPIETLCRFADIAAQYLSHIHIGNVSPEEIQQFRKKM